MVHCFRVRLLFLGLFFWPMLASGERSQAEVEKASTEVAGRIVMDLVSGFEDQQRVDSISVYEVRLDLKEPTLTMRLEVVLYDEVGTLYFKGDDSEEIRIVEGKNFNSLRECLEEVKATNDAKPFYFSGELFPTDALVMVSISKGEDERGNIVYGLSHEALSSKRMEAIKKINLVRQLFALIQKAEKAKATK